MRRATRQLFLPLLLFTFTAGCKGTSSSAPAAPSAIVVNLAGSWRGTATDSSGPGTISLQITQSGTNLTGTASLSVITATGRGTLTGTVSGSSIHLTIAIPAGGFDGPFGSCTASVTGDGAASPSSITLIYTGTNSCSGPITKGELTLSKG
jgi:hypothetical protein